MSCAPVLSLAASAPFTFDTSLSQPVLQSNQLGYVVASSDSEGIYILLTFDPSIDIYGGRGLSLIVSSNNDLPAFHGFTHSTGTIQYNLSYYDLKSGYLLTTETGTTKIIVGGGVNWENLVQIKFSRILSISNYLDTPYYYYSLGSSYPMADDLDSVPVDSFVNWNSSGGSGSGGSSETPDPVDPNSVIRSRIPRPYGNATTMYIADHLYLYAIYMGVPQQFEEQGLIQTSLDPAKYEGDNYNLYDVTMSASGSTLNLVIKNRAQFSYNCIISKYDVVDGSYISSDIRAITVASSADQPSTNNMSISLSDPATYGIYQSGFFARSQTIAYPELRISWSDTIDYSLDFFVIRQGLVTIIEGIGSTNTALGTANSTLSTISSTSSSILSAINSFYTLCDNNFTWFKTTYYNSILNRWDINKSQLDIIISLIQGNGETTYPENQSVSDSVNNYVSQEDNYFSQFDEAGSDADVVFDEAISQFTANSNGFSFIRMILQTFVFNVPSSYIIVFVSLTFGLVILIIGRVIGGNKA